MKICNQVVSSSLVIYDLQECLNDRYMISQFACNQVVSVVWHVRQIEKVIDRIMDLRRSCGDMWSR